ncbi:4Fe-4S binding protein [Clostridium sp. DL1XJH146]
MNIAILSGKGGTGKTTVSTNLAKILGATYIDCDVEEPNGFIFLNPEIIKRREVKVLCPVIDKDKCTLCGECSKACQFNSLAQTKKEVMFFENLCHGCGTCELVCKYDAIHFEERRLGIVEEGIGEGIHCKRGLLDIGEPMAVPIIRAVTKDLEGEMNLLDCSPGTSCNAVNTLEKADRAILVTETTEFALHDLKLAVSLVRKMNIPYSIIINKEISEDNIIRDYCMEEKISILGAVPYSRDIAALYSKGELIVNMDEMRELFTGFGAKVKEVSTWN